MENKLTNPTLPLRLKIPYSYDPKHWSEALARSAMENGLASNKMDKQ